MTSPTSVGEVSVEVLADASKMAKKLREDFEKSFKTLDLGKKIRESVDDKPIKVPVDPEVDADAIPEQTKKSRVPKVPVPLDPVLDAFVAEVRRQTKALAKQVNAQVPIGADTSGLREELGVKLQAVAAQTRAEIPVEPEEKGKFQQRLQAQLAEVSTRLKASVKVEPDTSEVPAKVAATPVPDVPVKVEPETSGFESRLRSAVAAAAKRVRETVRVNVDAGGGGRDGNSIQRGLQGAVGAAGSLVGALQGAVSAAAGLAGTLGPIGAVVVGIGAAATLLAPAFAAAAGAAGAIPAALAGIGAAVGTLALGFSGIGAAFKSSGGGGGGGVGSQAANQARQVASASRQVEAARRGIAAANRQAEASERSLAAAQRAFGAAQRTLAEVQDRARRSQEAVNEARRQAKEDVEDLSRALRGAKLSEEDAAYAVEDALLALDEARQTGDLRKIREAELAYRRAQLAVEETADATQDLQEKADEANTKGIEGSDVVQDALDDQKAAWEAVRDAQDGVADATDGLKSAQDGVASALDGVKSAADGLASAQESLAAAQTKVATGGGGVAKEVTKLAPAAQRFVNAVKALKPAFDGLRLEVQQRLFAGLDKTVTRVGDKWIPALRTTLGSYADTFNKFFRNLGTSITTPKFISDTQAGAEGFRQLLDKLGTSITSKLVPAFGALSRAAGPFLSKLGDELAGVVTKFSEWVLKGEKTGGLTRFFDKASAAMHDIFDIGGEVAKIVGLLFEIITGKDTGSGKTPLESFRNGLVEVNKWLKDPENQQKIRDFITDLKEFAVAAAKFGTATYNAFKKVKEGVGFVQEGWRLVKESFYKALNDFGLEGDNTSLQLGKAVGGALTGTDTRSLPEKFRQAGKDMIDGLTGGMIEKLSLFSVAKLLWEGPDSLLGKIKAGLGIQSPSTVMMQVGRDLIAGLILGMAEKLTSLAKTAAQLPGKITSGIGNIAEKVKGKGGEAVTGLMTGISNGKTRLSQTASTMRTTVQNALSTAGTWLTEKGRQAATSLGNGMVGYYQKLKERAGIAKGYVVNAMYDAGTWLWDAGRAIISGLMRGIQSKLGDLGTFLGDVGKFIQDNKGPIEKDRKLLIPAGRAIMGSLITGIRSEQSALVAQLGDLTGLIEDEGSRVKSAADRIAAAAIPDVSGASLGLGLDLDANLTRSLQVAENRQLVAQWAPGATGDQFLDGLRRMIQLKYRGDSVAALSS